MKRTAILSAFVLALFVSGQIYAATFHGPIGDPGGDGNFHGPIGDPGGDGNFHGPIGDPGGDGN